MAEWISVNDKMPEDVYGKDREQITVLVYTKGKAEAVKEIAEKVLLYIPNIEGDTTIKCVEEAIKQTLKETVGEYGQ